MQYHKTHLEYTNIPNWSPFLFLFLHSPKHGDTMKDVFFIVTV
jgi:hypothetical protein